MSLNEEVQRDIDCEVRLINVPDSVIFITPPPEQLKVNVRARGTQMLRYQLGSTPHVDIDFRYFTNGNRLNVSKADMHSLVQAVLGDENLLQAMTPDTIGVYFTTAAPVTLPVEVAASAVTTPSVALVGPLEPVNDSVKVYAINPLAKSLTHILTEPVTLTDINASCTRKVALAVPQGCRIIPDSVSVRIEVEPVVTRSQFVPIYPENVPPGAELVLEPAEVRVEYRVPKSKADQLPEVELIADYASVPTYKRQSKIRIRPARINPDIFVTVDSVGYYLRNLEDPDALDK